MSFNNNENIIENSNEKTNNYSHNSENNIIINEGKKDNENEQRAYIIARTGTNSDDDTFGLEELKYTFGKSINYEFDEILSRDSNYYDDNYYSSNFQNYT